MRLSRKLILIAGIVLTVLLIALPLSRVEWNELLLGKDRWMDLMNETFDDDFEFNDREPFLVKKLVFRSRKTNISCRVEKRDGVVSTNYYPLLHKEEISEYLREHFDFGLTCDRAEYKELEVIGFYPVGNPSVEEFMAQAPSLRVRAILYYKDELPSYEAMKDELIDFAKRENYKGTFYIGLRLEGAEDGDQFFMRKDREDHIEYIEYFAENADPVKLENIGL